MGANKDPSPAFALAVGQKGYPKNPIGKMNQKLWSLFLLTPRALPQAPRHALRKLREEWGSKPDESWGKFLERISQILGDEKDPGSKRKVGSFWEDTYQSLFLVPGIVDP